MSSSVLKKWSLFPIAYYTLVLVNARKPSPITNLIGSLDSSDTLIPTDPVTQVDFIEGGTRSKIETSITQSL